MNQPKHPVAQLRRLAKKAGRQFAELIGISYPRLVAIEAGRLQLPEETALRIAAIFGLQVDSLRHDGELKTWDGVPLTAAKLREFMERPHDPGQFTAIWTPPVIEQLMALIEAAASDASNSRVLLAEFTNWMEEMRSSLQLENATKEALPNVGRQTKKRQLETSVDALRAWFLSQKVADRFHDECFPEDEGFADQWREIDIHRWPDATKATLVEEIAPLWSPLYDPSIQTGGKAPTEWPFWRYAWKIDVFVSGDFAGTISSVHMIPNQNPYDGGLGWKERIVADPAAAGVRG